MSHAFLFMKRLLLSFLVFTQSGLFAQNPATEQPCLFDALNPPATLRAAEARISAAVAQLKSSNATENSDDIRLIPVVVHVIHNGGSENISKAQIERQIEILNEDFGKLPGTPGDGAGVDTRVRFCLANTGPQGRCTDGIVRLKTPLTTHQPVDRASLKNLSFWDNTRYLNMYVVKTISNGVGGYSSFPYAPPEEDGLVVRHNLFGDSGTAAAAGGRTATHEIGHWLGLYHTFNGGCGQDTCSDGDYVCDTPPAANPNFTCNLNVNSCGNDNPNLPDQVRNYMDYTPDDCKSIFTQGQKDRITATLDSFRTLIWTPDNVVVTGCDSAYMEPPVCLVVADFVTLTPQVCLEGIVYFIDRSLNSATSWQWLFPGGMPATSTLQNPTITYDTLGTFSVTLIATNANGSDTLFLENYVQVTEPGIGQSLPFSANFDDGVFPPTGAEIYNPDLGIQWELDSLAAHSPPYAARIDNLVNVNYGTRDEIVLPFLDLSTSNPDSALLLTFWWAYARSDPNYSDELIVQISKDCGVNYTNILTKSGNALVTGPTQTTPFIPTAAQWRKATVNLFQYRTEEYVKIRFVNVTDGGNRLYLDDIQIDGGLVTGTVEPERAAFPVRIFPNPAFELVRVQTEAGWNEPIHIRVFDTLGRLLRDYGPDPGKTLDLAGLPAGLIFFKIESAGQVVTLRLIKVE
ncbi:MAG: T9SS type A sorting domain-containing protein [Saprospiraceae bacterium]|nr:T9SS type A sorting domain-containing protein [Saprospiraceae bacterium]